MPTRNPDSVVIRRAGAEHAGLIAPLGSAGRADEIAARLTEAIHLGLIADGDRLPAELDFAQQLGVSPMTLREAIAALRRRGLVETRRGRHGGTFVKRVVEPPEARDRRRLAETSVLALRDAADEHAAISGAAAKLAAERATPANVRKILALAEQTGSAASRGARMKADTRFHVEIAISTRSERLTRREVALQSETTGLLWLPHLGEAEVRRMAIEHREIASAIAAEDPERARERAEHHVRRNLRRLTAAHLALVGGSA